MLIKTAVSHHYRPLRVAKIKKFKRTDIWSTGEGVEQMLTFTAEGNVQRYIANLENNLIVS